VEDFIQQCWGENVKRTTMKSLAGKIEETRKEYGNSFGGLVSHLKNKLPSSIHKPCLAFSTSA
jgi:hypothetical protein